MDINCADYRQAPVIVYQVLSGQLLGELHSQVLVLGIFAVFLGFLREFMEPDLREGAILKRSILFLGVLLFTSYVAFTYTLEGEAAYPFEDIGNWWHCAALREKAPGALFDDQTSLKVLLLTLTPIDLLAVGLIAFLFVVIAQVKIGQSSDPRSNGIEVQTIALSLNRHLPLLYLATGLAHAMFALWWYIRALITAGEGAAGTSDVTFDIQYHAQYALVYAVTALGNYILYRVYKPKKIPEFFQWIGVCGYFGLTVSTYIYRTATYFEKLLG